ncbi:enkurin [Trichonephila clavata]|uniref:Enkurin n=1 Tax=Trichonephila clavata TaxID=2740835 RepID=A0A8X6HTA8_TRICU|nr:enkurin [Trichonephila clavata]
MIVYPRLENHPYFSENLYNLIDSRELKAKQTPETKVIEQCKAAKSPIPRTMGYAHTSLKSPQDFLKKHSSQPQKLKKSQTERNKCVACQSRKNKSESSPPVSKYQDTVLPSTEDRRRNFIQENVLQVVKRPNTTPMKRIRDNRKGDPFVLEESGWVPKYSQKEDYGKTPSYIDRIKQNLKLSQEKFASYMTAKEPYDLPTELRKLMIEGLVKNLKILFNKYLTLPLHIETPAQKKRKIGLERKIDELQKDIDLIQRNEEILVLKE